MVGFSKTTYTMGVRRPTQTWHMKAKEVTVDPFCMDVYEYPNQKGEYPKGVVSWTEAQQLCTNLGKRLCSSAEWELACRGTEGRMYSYGNQYELTRCNTPIQDSGPKWRKIPLEKSGTYKDCHSPEGVYDLNGSLSEWVSDPWSDFPESFSKNAVVDPETWRELRGGTMWNRTFYGQDCTSRHGHRKRNAKYGDDGFRCCSNR